MLTHLSDILTYYVLPGLILAFGLCFQFIHVPQDEAGLRGYRMARRMMSYATSPARCSKPCEPSLSRTVVFPVSRSWPH